MLIDIDSKDLKFFASCFSMAGDKANAEKYRNLAKDAKQEKFVCVKAKYNTKHAGKGGHYAAVSAESVIDAALQFASRGNKDAAKTLMLLAAMQGGK